MNRIPSFAFAAITMLMLASCNKESVKLKNISNVSMKVRFSENKSQIVSNNENPQNGVPSSYQTKDPNDDLTKQTPENYYVALKSATLIGDDETADFELFDENTLGDAFVFDFADDNTTRTLLDGKTIPDGKYSGVRIEIYYLQMKLNIATDLGISSRNIRIYLSDDNQTEGGLHQPGDITQISDANIEEGWLLGNGQIPDFAPISPRIMAYATDSIWMNFGGKDAKDFGPFGDVDFANNSPHPIYSEEVSFVKGDRKGTKAILQFDVYNCWQFEDKNGDGNFGPADLDTVIATRWHMAMPLMSISLIED
jgi:hypothetical protein